jgi:outer membrane protein, heavy metal efflux system
VVIGCLCGCATYHPEPLDAAKVAQQFDSRSLSNPGLCQYLGANITGKLPSCPPPQWNLAALTLVGFYYNPEIAVAEARVREADAAIISARAVPNPTVHAGPQYREASSPNFAPWGIGSFSLDLPLETAGKRGYRMSEAERLVDAAELAAGATAWTVHSRIRAALLQYLIDTRQTDLVRQNENALAQTAALFAQRLKSGEGSRSELDLALATLQSARLKTAQAEVRVPEDRNALAMAMGLPVEALGDATFSWPALDNPPNQNSLSAAAIQKLALLNRIDLRGELAQYAAADEALKLEIAKQYPDINLAGGYSWEGGENLFDLGPSLVIPIFNQNQGPIAQAEARRKEIAAQFVAMQAGIVAQSRTALASYRGALAALEAAHSAAAFQLKRLDQARRAAAAGEVDSVTLIQTRLEDLAEQQSFLASLANVQTALGILEDSIQRPLDSGDVGPFILPALRDSKTEQTDED